MSRHETVCRASRLWSRGLLLVLAVLTSSTAFAQSQDEIEYFLTDAIGSVRVVTNANGAVVEDLDYLPFGEPWSAAGATEARRFGGKELDRESGLDYFGARYYASQTGRFTTVDPVLDIQAARLNPRQWNRYAYVSNNPLRKVDPTGGYEVDVHSYLTRVLARAVGIDKVTAERIGAADQGVDDNPNTGPFADRAARRDFHFTSPTRRTQLWNAFEDTGSPEDLGIFFHAQQDSFSHEGFGPNIGHLLAGHRPDKTFNAPDKADAMARDTYDRLKAAVPYLRGQSGKVMPWEKVRPYIMRFNRATELDDKYRILDELTGAIEAYK